MIFDFGLRAVALAAVMLSASHAFGAELSPAPSATPPVEKAPALPKLVPRPMRPGRGAGT